MCFTICRSPRCRARFLAVTLLSVMPLTSPAQPVRPSSDEVARAVDSLARRIVATGLAPALGVAVVMDGRTILSMGYGEADRTRGIPVTPNTLWYIASTSKSFTGFAVTLLAGEGALDLEAPITRVLPRAQWHPDVNADALTLRRFLSHAHHLTDGVIVMSAAFTGAMPETAWPGLLRYSAPAGHSDLVYSNFGYNVAAMAIDAVRPEGWRRFMAQRMFAPLGMQQTFARVSGLDRDRIAMPHDLRADGSQPTMPVVKTDATMNSAGGHLATLDDLARWVTVQLDSGMLEGRRVFPKAAVVQSQTQITAQTRDRSKQFAFFDRAGWSAGWDIGTYEGERMVSRFGSYSSTRSHLSMLPGRRIGVVALTTGRVASLATDIVAAYAYDLEAGRPDAEARVATRLDTLRAQVARAPRQVAQSDSVRASRQRPMDRALADFAGTYRNDGLGTITFRLDANRLHWDWGALRGEAELFDAAKHALRIELAGSGYVGEFEFPERGPARSVQLDGMRFSRVK